ncbi:ankyrin repeat protein nuc-2, partial [Aureobasidium melanogenum]
RDVIRDLSDQATSSLLELGAWAEGEKIEYIPSGDQQQKPQAGAQEDNDIEMQMQQAVNTGNEALIKEWISRLGSTDEAKERISRIFLSTINDAPLEMQKTLLETDLVNLTYVDEINERTCLHELSISGRLLSLTMLLERGANPMATDIYGRIPLHYACMRGHVDAVKELVKHDSANTMQGIESTSPNAAPVAESVDYKDLDNFTPLIHGIVHARFAAVQAVLELGARVDPTSEADHIPINLACQYGSVAIVDLLLQYHPQILPDAEGLYPQHLVPRSGRSPQILQMLKNYGANLDQPDKLYQWTPLFHAASEGHLSCLQALLELGVDVDALDEKDLSAMYYAAWEGQLDCLRLLEKAGHGRGIAREEPTPAPATFQSILSSSAPIPASADMEAIPDLSLPPPIIPLRRYGHNFLDTTKTFIVISFDSQDADAIEFYGDNKYPAARLTISSKSSDLIPRNIPLPIQDEFKVISFQIDNLDTFSIDFDIFPTFGSKIIARGAASSLVFSRRYSSSGNWHLELFDPRLRAIGRISFKYQVVTPFHGIPMEITQFATYWKATSQISSQPNALITGSSLSGDYMRIFVQATKDGVPVLYPSWAMPSALAAYGVRNDLISRLTYEQFSAIGKANGKGPDSLRALLDSSRALLAQGLANSWCSLRDVLEILPPQMHLDVHMLFPTKAEE